MDSKCQLQNINYTPNGPNTAKNNPTGNTRSGYQLKRYDMLMKSGAQKQRVRNIELPAGG